MYIDGFVFAVPAANKAKFIEHAKAAAAVLKDHGATRIVECWGDDVPDGKLTSFPMAVKCEEGEVVCFSWVEYPDKETRERCMETSMKDPRFAEAVITDMPLDGKRMIFGGFMPVLTV